MGIIAAKIERMKAQSNEGKTQYKRILNIGGKIIAEGRLFAKLKKINNQFLARKNASFDVISPHVCPTTERRYSTFFTISKL